MKLVRLLLCFMMFFMMVSCADNPENELIKNMTLEEKVAQLFIVSLEQLNPEYEPDKINKGECSDINLPEQSKDKLKKMPVTGVILFGRNIVDEDQLKTLISDIKGNSDYPMFMAIDEEGGLVARVANSGSFNVKKYESMEAVGNTGDPTNAYEAGSTISSYLKDLGFNLDFAPVADCNTNPENVVIGNRAFSDNPDTVSSMVSSFIDGLHENGILATIKHFPGHGDVKNDTHSGLVVTEKSWDELKKVELVPFVNNFEKTDFVMTAHISVPETIGDNTPSSLSYEMITGKLRNELGYKGLVITDALNMGAIIEYAGSTDPCVLALQAGADILLMPYDFDKSYNAVLNAVKNGEISEKRIDESLERIIAKKIEFGIISGS